MNAVPLTALLLLGAQVATAVASAPPNVVIVLIDDMGYADIGPFGRPAYPTPNLDRMAAEGRVFTDFHAASAVCSESRAALLTGCYPPRVNIRGALFGGDAVGLHRDEVTIAEVCKTEGYATACVGKWHLGDKPEFFPSSQGFDEWFGLPYSNDMWPYKSGEHTLEAGVKQRNGRDYDPLPLYAGDAVVDPDVTPDDQKLLTKRYTERAVGFIERHAGERPFFLYLPHTMVHVPLYASDDFDGKSGAGVYGDVVMEIDWSVGQIMEALKRTGVDGNTLLVFTSDNGPWLKYGDHGGSAAPLREGKNTMWEGGHRVPCIMRWPARISAGSECDALLTALDLLPTIARAIGAELPDRVIDGEDALAVIVGEDNASPREVFYGYHLGGLKAVRDPRWKLVLPHRYDSIVGGTPGADGRPGRYAPTGAGLELYDLDADVTETNNVAEEHPGVVARLLAVAEAARAELGDRLTDRKGKGVRPVGRVEPFDPIEPQP
ncbi:MAG: sulfatase [Planctomycetota bacterium]